MSQGEPFPTVLLKVWSKTRGGTPGMSWGQQELHVASTLGLNLLHPTAEIPPRQMTRVVISESTGSHAELSSVHKENPWATTPILLEGNRPGIGDCIQREKKNVY